MINLGYLFENNINQNKKMRKSMEEHFIKRTNYHIDLVKKYLDEIINLNDHRLNIKLLEKEKGEHDLSKFQEPEYEPYLHVNWSYHMKDLGAEYIPSDIIKNQMQSATFHHVKINMHHPESWDKDVTESSINSKDHDKVPDKMVDATDMPSTYVAMMVADWLAMSEEKETDPYKWCDQNINKRWQFDQKQVKLIYDLLDKIWNKKK